MNKGALDSFVRLVPKTPSTNASLNQNNESQEHGQSVCGTSINASNIVSTSFIDVIGTVSK